MKEAFQCTRPVAAEMTMTRPCAEIVEGEVRKKYAAVSWTRARELMMIAADMRAMAEARTMSAFALFKSGVLACSSRIQSSCQ